MRSCVCGVVCGCVSDDVGVWSRMCTRVHMSYVQRTSNSVMRGSGVGAAASSLIDRTNEAYGFCVTDVVFGFVREGFLHGFSVVLGASIAWCKVLVARIWVLMYGHGC